MKMEREVNVNKSILNNWWFLEIIIIWEEIYIENYRSNKENKAINF